MLELPIRGRRKRGTRSALLEGHDGGLPRSKLRSIQVTDLRQWDVGDLQSEAWVSVSSCARIRLRFDSGARVSADAHSRDHHHQCWCNHWTIGSAVSLVSQMKLCPQRRCLQKKKHVRRMSIIAYQARPAGWQTGIATQQGQQQTWRLSRGDEALVIGLRPRNSPVLSPRIAARRRWA
jgi:hypothetical protein